MNEHTAVEKAQSEFPQIKDWHHTAFAVLPTPTSPIESATWLVLTESQTHYALVDGGPGSVLLKKI